MAYRKKGDRQRLEGLNAEFQKRYASGDLLRAVDTRTSLGQALRDMRRALTEHVGSPSTTQAILIDELCFLAVVTGTLRNHYLTKAGNGELAMPTQSFTAMYGSWHRMYVACLRELGFRKPETSAVDLRSYLEGKKGNGD